MNDQTEDNNSTKQVCAQEELAKRDREIQALYKLSEIFQSSSPLNELYHNIVEEICIATGFPIAIIAIHDKARQKISFQGAKGLPESADHSILEASIEETLSGVVVQTGKPLILTHADDQSEHRSKILHQLGVQTFIGYPMIVGQKIVGALGLAHPSSIEISAHTAQWIESLANFVAALTERKRSEEELRSSHEQLRALSIHHQSAIEEERKRIAREIHDELGQELALLQLELGLLESDMPVQRKDLQEKIRVISKLAESSIRSVQRISSNLRPTLLDNLGLGAAVEWQTKEFQKRTTIQCEVIIEPSEIKVDQDISTALFRILQEALTNVARHAHATKIDVRLVMNDQTIELNVSDNGTGITPERVTDPQSFGLIGMRERMYPLGGNVNITGTPGKGTLLTVVVPRKS